MSRPLSKRCNEACASKADRKQIGTNAPEARLIATTLERQEWDTGQGRNLELIRDVVAVHRLREVMRLYGFTRAVPL